jgi:uncharacterized protein YegP (UPF0339 family)
VIRLVMQLEVWCPMPTVFELYFDDTRTKPWSFNLLDDDGNVLFESKNYKTKAAAASVASRKLKKQ